MSFPLPYFSCRIPQIATPTVAKAACLSFRLEVHAERSVLRRSTHHHQWPNPHAIPFRGWNSTRTRGLPGGTPSWPKPHNLKSTRIRGGTTGDSRIRMQLQFDTTIILGTMVRRSPRGSLIGIDGEMLIGLDGEFARLSLSTANWPWYRRARC